MSRIGRPLWRGLAAGCLVLPLLGGCLGDRDEEPGVVATVDGTAIRLADLEARHDLERLGVPRFDNPAVERLRAEYGAALADMIVARLARQELERRGLAPTGQELAALEGQVREDYPGDAFDAMLLEEHIDLARWREMLADRLTLEKLAREVLRPNIRVGVPEAAAYYKQHIEAFTQPARVRLLLVQGRDAESVKAALAGWRKTGQRSSLEGAEDVRTQEATLPEQNLPASWKESLKGVKPGEATPLRTSGREHFALVLLERIPETVLEPAKAYARVEAVLTAARLDQEFASWLARALSGAKISVSSRLLRPAGDGASGEQAEAAGQDLPETPAGDADGREAQTLAEKREDGERAGMTAAPTDKDGKQNFAEGGPDVSAESAVQPGDSGQTPMAGHLSPAASSASPPFTQDQQPPAADRAGGDVASQTDGQPASAPLGAGQTSAPPAPPVTADSGKGGEEQAPVVAAAGQSAEKSGQVELAAVKASWVRYAIDDAPEERVYLKPASPIQLVFKQRLVVRLGSPSEVKYRYNGKEHVVEVGKKENRVLEFP